MANLIGSRHVAVLGAGPAGLWAAEKLAISGAAVTVYDQMPTAGRKFMMAGRGGLNLTHSEPLETFTARYGTAAEWLAPVIEAFPPEALRKWCEDLGQKTFVGSSGRVFPEDLKASPLLRAWLRRLSELGVQFALRHRWHGWNEAGQLVFTRAEGVAVDVKADATVLALGGASWPRLGSDGSWVGLLRAEGIDVAVLRPANCGFFASWSAIFSERFAGQPLKPIKFSFQGITLQGEAMVTRDGLEGSAIYALSSPLRNAIDVDGHAVLTVDLRPGLSVEELTERLRAPRGSQSASTYLRKAAGLAPVAIGLMRESLGGAALPTALPVLAALIKNTPITLTAASPIMRAISSAGGIRRDELDAHFMLKKKPGVFAVGEMLDWEAPTGGYLLQACFSIADAAAKGVVDYLVF
jgi:uncharacterized flavoprotein (TIGR03862 family)